MEVELTIENPDGGQSRVSASGATYEDALAKATDLVPDGCRRIVIRKYIS